MNINFKKDFLLATQSLIDKEIKPFASTWEKEETGLPQSVIKLLRELGYFGLLVPTEFGGSNLDMTSYALITEVIASGDCGLCNMINASNSPVATAIRDHGTSEQKSLYLADLASGKQTACFMLTETSAGSDASAISTKASLSNGCYQLTGTKQFVTAGQSAQFSLVIAVTDPIAGKKGLSAFLIPRSGYEVIRLEDKLGHRNCDTASIRFLDERHDRSCLLGKEGDGYKIALSYLNGGRIGVGAQAVGVAKAALDCALDYAQKRETFGKKIIEHQAIAARISSMATRLTAARQLVLLAARLVDEGKDAIVEASMAKSFASQNAEIITSDAIQVLGGYGYLKDYPLEKYYRDARVLSIYEGTNDIQNIVIARGLNSGWSTSDREYT